KTELDDLEIQLRKLPALIERMGKLEAQIDAVGQAEIRLAEDTARLEEIQIELSAESFAADIRQQLAMLDERQAELGYDQTTHDDARRLLREHHRYDQLQTRLAIAIESLPTLQEAINGSYARKERLTGVMAETQEEI